MSVIVSAVVEAEVDETASLVVDDDAEVVPPSGVEAAVAQPVRTMGRRARPGAERQDEFRVRGAGGLASGLRDVVHVLDARGGSQAAR
ncbi:hypothetical protein ACOKGD_07490 [Microbacterium phosphatis]|uniref:hypothetical protein n=1 Tax=Microbacterium phosphatis TaxID=3140248 RepID=UPI003140B084